MSDQPDIGHAFTATIRHRWRKRLLNEQAMWFSGGFDGTGYILEQAWLCRETGEVRWQPVEVEG